MAQKLSKEHVVFVVQSYLIYISPIRKIPGKIRVIITDKIRKIIERWASKGDGKEFIFPYLNHTMNAEQKKKKTKIVSVSINTQMRKLTTLISYNGDITTYTARHSYGTILINLGAPMAAISENFGHSSIAVTENYFDGFETDIQKELAEKLGSLF